MLPKPKLTPGELDRLKRARARKLPLPSREAQPGKLSTTTWCTMAVTAAAGTVAALELAPVATLAVALGAGVVALFGLFANLITPSPRGRRSAEAAAECFAVSVRNGRLGSAYACLYPGALAEPVMRPRLPELAVEPLELSLSSPEALRRYWWPVLHRDAALWRDCPQINVMHVVSSEHRASCELILHVRYGGTFWVRLLRSLLLLDVLGRRPPRSVWLSFRVVLLREREQWWLLPPTFAEARPDAPYPELLEID